PLDLEKTKADLATKLKRATTEDDLYSHLMYPEVFAQFVKFLRDFTDVSPLPTSAFFYGLTPGEEISIDIEEGKTLFLKLINIGAVDQDGSRTLLFELNGMPREATIIDRSVQSKTKARVKADPADPLQMGAPLPGLVTSIAAGVGAKVAKGAKILTLESMKMQTTLYASADGIVGEIHIKVGDSVESKD